MKRALLSIIILVLFGALFSSVKNTLTLASDFESLLILASIPSEKRSYNLFSDDFFWVTQDMAVSIIENYEYPYNQCSPMTERLQGCGQPRIEQAGRFIGMVDSNTEMKFFSIISFLIEKKEPIDAYGPDGYTALQGAILSNSPRLVAILLEAGADPQLVIKGRSKFKGQNSIQFLETLFSKRPEEFAELRETFYKYVPNQAFNRTT